MGFEKGERTFLYALLKPSYATLSAFILRETTHRIKRSNCPETTVLWGCWPPWKGGDGTSPPCMRRWWGSASSQFSSHPNEAPDMWAKWQQALRWLQLRKPSAAAQCSVAKTVNPQNQSNTSQSLVTQQYIPRTPVILFENLENVPQIKFSPKK